MAKANPENEVAKRNYLRWLEHAEGRDEETAQQVAAALARFEAHNGHKPFSSFNLEQAISFKKALEKQTTAAGRPLSTSTRYSILRHLKGFFEWLSRERGYRRSVKFADAAYFKTSANDARVATARRPRPAPSLEQVHHVLAAMPTQTPYQRRDRAVVSLILLTGARDGAAASIRLHHLDMTRRTLFQDARQMATKRGKTFISDFYPVGGDAEAIVDAWKEELATVHLFSPDDPLFPATLTGCNAEGVLGPMGLTREPWANADPIRRIFRAAFEGADLPYYNPHSLRQTIMRHGYELGLSMKELKAWSQNMGHDSIHTSLSSYGHLDDHEKADVMRGIGARAGSDRTDRLAELKALVATL
ncbi:MAG TPA: tyrosine-type recombinase/integrase [Caulobacteraceae bacterium]